MNDAAPTAPANITPPSRWQFSLRTLFILTAIVAALLALILAGQWIFMLQLLLSTLFGVVAYIFTRRAMRKPAPPQIAGMLRVFLVLAVVGVASSLWLGGQTLTDALLHIGLAAGAIGGYLAAIDASGRLPDKALARSWRYIFGGAVAFLLAGWGALHAIEKSYDTQTERHARQIQERGLSWSWGKSTNRMFGPVPLFRLRTLDVHDWRRRATDDDLEAIAAVDLVNSLQVTGCPITDAGLAYLKSLHKLQSLDVRHTRVTSRAIDELRQSLPNLTDVKH